MQVPILAFSSFMIILAFLFYMGQRFHSNLMHLSVAVYQSEWYQYPRSVQCFVLLMMMRSQQPFYLSAYGMMRLNLETFVGVCERLYINNNDQFEFIYSFVAAQIDVLSVHVIVHSAALNTSDDAWTNTYLYYKM